MGNPCPNTVAERLLDLADAMRRPKHQVICGEKPVGDWVYACIVLALALEDSPPALKIRAIIEGWDEPRIVREIY